MRERTGYCDLANGIQRKREVFQNCYMVMLPLTFHVLLKQEINTKLPVDASCDPDPTWLQ